MPRFTASPAFAAAALDADALVALPTETVYGLGGLASSPDAIARIFATKGRPATHPVIVHVRDSKAIDSWAQNVPQTARHLADAFWPGPLTIVVPRADHVSDAITGGQPTVALRAPDHPLFAAVLAELTTTTRPAPGIAAPSANRFGRVSPTSALHVKAELDPYLGPDDLILDGGECTVGVESTIVICRPRDVVVARSGGITDAQLREVVPVADAVESKSVPRVPGSLASHYAPRARVTLVTSAAELSAVREDLALNADVGVICLSTDSPAAPPHWIRLATPTSSEQYARELYAALRRGDELGLTRVIALAPPDAGIGEAVRDRLQRASS
ncbi:MAG: L-threonylcarbamoyladenylate synthase [Candidatus Nanopelagicales bacterium]